MIPFSLRGEDRPRDTKKERHMTQHKLHPDSLNTNFERHEYSGAILCAIGGVVAERAKSTDASEVESWSRQITILQEIVWSIRRGEYRPTDESIDEGIDAEADRCSSHIDCGEGGAA